MDAPPFLHSDKQSYKYSGADLTPSPDWSHHVNRMLQTAKEKGRNTLASAASMRQQLQVINTDVRPCITYAAGAAVLSYADKLWTRACAALPIHHTDYPRAQPQPSYTAIRIKLTWESSPCW